ncbi:MAG: TRAP transporter small permease [Nitratireductor sp.]
MRFLRNSLKLLRQACLLLAIFAGVFLFAVVSLNIIARLIFDLSDGAINFMLSGAIELAQYSLMVLIFAAIPAALNIGTAGKSSNTGLIRVDVFSQKFSHTVQNALNKFWLLCIAAFALVLVAQFFEQSITTFYRGDETQDLRLPLWIFYALASVANTALALLALAQCFGISDQNEVPSLEGEM